jgi:hypothetical protein
LLESAQHGAGPGVADHGVAFREDGVLLDELVDDDLLRHPPQTCGPDVLSGCNDDPVYGGAVGSAQGGCAQQVA